MNINLNINKLLYALKQKEQYYKINSFQFYNEKKDKYSTKYQVLKKEFVEVFNEKLNKVELQKKYIEKKECYNKVELLKYLAEEYRDRK